MARPTTAAPTLASAYSRIVAIETRGKIRQLPNVLNDAGIASTVLTYRVADIGEGTRWIIEDGIADISIDSAMAIRKDAIGRRALIGCDVGHIVPVTDEPTIDLDTEGI